MTAYNFVVKAAGTAFLFGGLVFALGGSPHGWSAFVGGCVLFGAAHVVEMLRRP